MITPTTWSVALLWRAAKACRALLISQVHRISLFLSTSVHSTLFTAYRTGIIRSRLILLANLFAVYTVLWAVGDFVAFQLPLALIIGMYRLATAMSFAALAIICRRMQHSRGIVFAGLAVLFCIAMVFFLGSERTLAIWHVRDSQSELTLSLALCYALMPFPLCGGAGRLDRFRGRIS